jgi:hypothetical protein
MYFYTTGSWEEMRFPKTICKIQDTRQRQVQSSSSNIFILVHSSRSRFLALII